MKKLQVWIVMSCLVFLFSGCSPQRVSEAKAKEAGLVLINQAFDADETEATVEYQEWAGATYVRGGVVQYGTEDPHRVYVVKVDPDEIGNARYYAEVDAETGVAYRAERSPSTIELTQEQQKQASTLGTLEDFNPDSLVDVQSDAMAIVLNLLQTRLELDVPLFRIYPDLIESDSVDFPKVRLEYILIMENAVVYDITLLWPSMDLIGVVMKNDEL
ncbi:MAG: hypothetical protein GX417_09180 [Clostridiales bacterium]|nr:hypothetical protein [Clostridiales bacterium]